MRLNVVTDGSEVVRSAEGEEKVETADADSSSVSASNVLEEVVLTPKKGKFVAIIPAYNEELTIGTVVLKVREHVDKVVVVNDGSADKTSEIARLAGAEVIDMDRNRGKASALMRGFASLVGKNYTAVVTIDGDGQHMASEIPKLIEPILQGEADLVIGSRFLGEKSSIPKYRIVGQKVLNKITNVGSGDKVSDTQSGFRAISAKGLQHMNFDSEGYAIESDMIVHFSDSGLKIKEVPTTVRYDVPNGHKKKPVSMGVALLNNIVGTIGYKRPLILFGVPGALFIFAGLVIGFDAIIRNYPAGPLLIPALAGGFFMMLGAFFCVSALTLNSLSYLMRMNSSK